MICTATSTVLGCSRAIRSWIIQPTLNCMGMGRDGKVEQQFFFDFACLVGTSL